MTRQLLQIFGCMVFLISFSVGTANAQCISCGCETAGTLTPPDVEQDGDGNYVVTDLAPFAIERPADAVGMLPDYAIIVETADGLEIFESSVSIDPPAVQDVDFASIALDGGIGGVAGVAYNLDSINILVSGIQPVCSLFFDEEICEVIDGIIDGGGIQSLSQALDIAGSFAVEVTDITTAAGALFTVDSAAQVVGGLGYAVTRWELEGGCQVVPANSEDMVSLWGGTSYNITSGSVGVDALNEQLDQIEIYPNPVQNKGIVEYNVEAGASLSLQLFDITGKMVREINLDQMNGRVEIDFSDMNAGIYSYSITDGAYISAGKKLMVMK